jgi:hypothetical protein
VAAKAFARSRRAARDLLRQCAARHGVDGVAKDVEISDFFRVARRAVPLFASSAL